MLTAGVEGANDLDAAFKDLNLNTFLHLKSDS